MFGKIQKYYPLILIAPFVIIRLFIIHNSSLTFFSDDAIYASFARFWAEHDFANVFHPFWPPLYPFLSSLIFPLTGNWETALRLVSLLSNLALLVPIYFLTKTQTSKLTATFVCISIFLITPIVEKSIFPMSDMLAASLIISSLTTFYFALLKNEARIFIFSAVLLGLTYLTRSEGIMFFGLLLFYLIIYLTLHVVFKKMPLKKLRILPLFIISFLLVTSPYVISTKTQLGYWSLSQKFNAQIQQEKAFELRNGETWAQEIWPIKSPNFSSKYWQGGGSFVLNNFYSLQKNFLEEAEKWKQLLLLNFPLWFITLSVIGLFWTKRKSFWADFFILYILCVAIPITIFSAPVIDIRYLLWTIPLGVVLFYKASFNVLRKLSSHSLIYFRILPFLLVLFLPSFSRESFDINTYSRKFTQIHYRPQLIEIAQFITEHKKTTGSKPADELDSDMSFSFIGETARARRGENVIEKHTTSAEPKIMTRHEAIEFYSKGQTVYMPEGTYSQVLDYAKKNKVDYIVAWNRELAREKELSELADYIKKHEGLNLETALSTPEGNIVVYTLK